MGILMAHISLCPTFAFRVLWCKAQNPKNVQDHSLLLHLHHRLLLHLHHHLLRRPPHPHLQVCVAMRVAAKRRHLAIPLVSTVLPLTLAELVVVSGVVALQLPHLAQRWFEIVSSHLDSCVGGFPSEGFVDCIACCSGKFSSWVVDF